MLRGTAIAVAIVAAIFAAALYASYRWADIAQVKAFAIATAQREPECASPRVRTALLSALRERRNLLHALRDSAGMYYAAMNNERTHDLIKRVVRDRWLGIVLGDDDVADAACAGLGSGPHRSLPKLARLVGLRSLHEASPQELGKLMHTFMRILHGGVRSDDDIRSIYAKATP